MNKILLVVLVLISNNSTSKIGLKLDIHGGLINPDHLLLKRALVAEKEGYLDSATSYYKKAARFGNDNAKYFLGMLYLKQKDWANGYAWLRLVDGEFANLSTLIPKIQSLIKPRELKSSNEIYKDIKSLYSDESALKRREKWKRSIKLTGSRIGGIDPISNVVIIYDAPFGVSGANDGKSLYASEILKSIDTFIYEYKPIRTKVILNEIELIDEN